MFDEVLSTDDRTNLTSHRKSRRLVGGFGEKGFDYAGNSNADLAVWASAKEAILVNASGGVRRRAEQRASVTRVFRPSASVYAGVIRASRPHQWLKNVLLFVPVVTGHKLGDFAVLLNASIGILAFCLCASSVYLVNDLYDLDSDREHPKKRFRPFASGQTPIAAGLLLAPALLVAGLILSFLLPLFFQIYLVIYCVASTLYSCLLKKIVLVDVYALAGLYTLRLLAGHAATGIAYSSWLLGFSMFLFLSLALLKRYIELRRLSQTPGARMAGRGYEMTDLSGIYTLGITSGFISALVLALYINSEEVKKLYRHPMTLLAICPLLLYWVSRVWFLATRQKVDEDPVVFALRDKTSYLIGAICAALIWLATAI
jgi:4-hydroxybenzoate polyprenyltransferase